MLPESAQGRAKPRIGRYVITGRLGKGGMGMVFRGVDENLEREVAIKTITAQGTATEESLKRFAIEAKAAARMQHPNIVAIYELSEDRGVKFIAMEYLKGTDLEALLRSDEELLLAERLDLVIQVCRGLAYAHERGIVHRDIKPANIGLLDDGTAKILDFGIAKMEGTQLTKTGMMVGTVHYMSPEQVRGLKLDGRSDVFSVGVILYQLLSGERPFQGEGPSQVLYKIVSEPPPPLDLSALADVGPKLQAIVERSLAKDKEARYADATELARDLQEVLDELRKTGPGAADPAALQAVATARKKLRAGAIQDSIAELQTLVTNNPSLVEARRQLRTALREQKKQSQPDVPQEQVFSELEATFQASPTRQEPETELQPTVVVAPDESGPGSRKGLALAAGAAALVLVAVAAFFLGGPAEPPPPAEVRVPVRSQPLGATLLVDGEDSGVVTNDVLVLPSPFPAQVELTFRKEGHLDEVRTVSLPLPSGDEISVTLQIDVPVSSVRSEPAGASVTLDGERVAGVTPLEIALDPESAHVLRFSLDGYVSREVQVAAGESPEEIETRLARLPPPGQVSVTSAYPVDVIWRGRTLASGQVSPQVDLPSGEQTLTLAASQYFLRREVSVSVPAGGQAGVQAPGIGRINVRAFPDNCEVFVGGASIGYPPIQNREVAAGRHTVSFRWPDGESNQQSIEVETGRPTFVTGRKE